MQGKDKTSPDIRNKTSLDREAGFITILRSPTAKYLENLNYSEENFSLIHINEITAFFWRDFLYIRSKKFKMTTNRG